MKDKIIFDFDCEVDGKKIYKCYRFICDEDNIMHLYYTCHEKDFGLEIVTNKIGDEKFYAFGSHFHFPMVKVPEIVKGMTEIFYTCNPWKDNWGAGVELDDSRIGFGIQFDERTEKMKYFYIVQSNGKDYGEDGFLHESIDLDWADAADVYVDDKKRIMPKGLAVLIKGIKDYYNTWQKEHPEYEKIK